MGVSIFAIAGRSGTAIAVLTLAGVVEHFSEFFENALYSLASRLRLSNELD
ncbi:MAG: hypothetical protein J07HQX50_02023 [Haloquadratum sp. J07HQX50]|jgi:hypothetical protein|nr:MAG: hypothetical protein J07HQX50_02023 [Haloquadratum sp. J07HQX50]